MKRGKFLAMLIATMVALAPTAAFADELMDLMELEELLFTEVAEVESTGFFKVKKTKAPGYSTVIAAQTIENSSARTLADVLETFAPGVSINRAEAYGSLVGMRGMAIDNNAKTLVMVDGMSVNPMTGAGYSNEYDLPLLGDVAKVEVINGPGAIVHGSGAISGFVNMIPKNGADFPGMTIETEYGLEEELYKTELGYGKSFGEGKDIYVYGGIVKANGMSENTDEWDRLTYNKRKNGREAYWAQYHPEEVNVKGFPNPSYKAGVYFNWNDFSLNALMTTVSTHYGSGTPYTLLTFEWNFGAPEPPDQYVEDDASYNTTTFALNPKYTFKLSDTETIDFIGTFQWMDHYLDSYEQYSGVAADGYWGQGGGRENNYNMKVIGRTERFEKLNFALGGSAGRREFDYAKSWTDRNKYEWALESEDATWHQYALFSEAVVDVTDKWAVSLGARYDQVSYSPIKSLPNLTMPDSQDNTSHRIATAYEIAEDTAVKLSYQEGFRVPDVTYHHYVEYWNKYMPSGDLTGLDIEEMSSTEFNFTTAIKDLGLTFDLNAYYNEYSKTIHWHDYNTLTIVDQATFNAVNAREGWFSGMANAPGKFRSIGGEIIAKWKINERQHLDFIYGYSAPFQVDDRVQKAIALTDDAKSAFIRYPTHQIKLNWTGYWLKDKLMTNLAYLYNSSYPVGKTSMHQLHSIYEQPRHNIDLAIAYRLTDDFSMKVVAKNLLADNSPHMTYFGEPASGSYGEQKRMVYLSAKYSF